LKEKKDGFKWTLPTRSGLLCHRFENCGVYYYSDIVENECASYIGIIVVKPKSSNHDIIVNQTSIEAGYLKISLIFNIYLIFMNLDIRPIEAGDRVWWRWDPKIDISISFLSANLLYDKKVDYDKCISYGK
jgi:hypothetical protein